MRQITADDLSERPAFVCDAITAPVRATEKAEAVSELGELTRKWEADEG
jgi:hypothetical protein